jgi:hypothetical protein
MCELLLDCQVQRQTPDTLVSEPVDDIVLFFFVPKKKKEERRRKQVHDDVNVVLGLA